MRMLRSDMQLLADLKLKPDYHDVWLSAHVTGNHSRAPIVEMMYDDVSPLPQDLAALQVGLEKLDLFYKLRTR